MLNSLSLITVMISSLFLAFYCVDSHKENILTMVNTDKKSITPISVNIEENLSKEAVKVVKPIEKVYVEVLAVEDINETSKIANEIKNESQIIIEEVAAPIEVKQEIKKVESIKEVEIEEVQIIEKIKTEDKITSEYSEGYKLDDLEKMIMEELKKGKKD